ncbi:autotransporter-associated beta strand repeat protein [Chthoniobacter flavus Ellin428]|uniref:Autotransporter-associated beta strand repeat protein n=2 Tax=Chthoniobacter flavus TaxID=191863 RepID=B4D829_9BACT|nr:autotransporter-associated beta strand repeat protein [Chthoniobacter flavus Ellin428]TCO87368.1 putative secreted protein with PEP-CTERM sorting signal [Chthoniobacter flavus]
MALAMLSTDDSTQAASGTWTGLTDGLWSAANGTNWSVAPAPGATTGSTNGDTATFNSAGNSNTTITIDAGRNIKSLLFDTAAANYIIGSGGANGGNPLILTSGGNITLASTVTGTNVVETFNAALTLAGSYSFTDSFADTGSALVFNGNITNTATSTLTLSGAGTGTGNLISGIVSDGVGVQSVTVSATNGTWTLSGANTYSGTTSITGANSFTVLAGSNNSAGGTTLNSATATLQLDSNSNGGLASGVLTLTTGKLEALGADRIIANAVTLQAVTVQGSHNLTFTGKMSGLSGGNRVLTNNIGAGSTLTLSDVDINADTGTNRSLTIAGTGDTIVQGTIANGGAGRTNSLVITNTGTTTLEGVNTYTGTTSIGGANAANAGTLRLSGAGVLGTGALTIFGGTLDINGLTRSLNGALTMGGGAAGSTAAINIGAGGVLTMGGNFTFSSSNSPNGAVISGGTLNLGVPRTFNIGDSPNAASDLTINSTIGDGNGIFDVTKSGAGTLEYTPDIDLTTLASPTPTVTVSSGILQLDGAVTGGNGIFDVNKTGAGILNYTRNLVLAANETATVTSGTLQFSGVISGSFGLTAANSSGVISLTVADTYTGNTILRGGGQLSLSGPIGSVVFSDVLVTAGSVLNLDSSAAGTTGTVRAKSVSLFENTGVPSTLLVTGNSGASSIDSIANALTAAAGMSVVTLQADPAQNTQLDASSFIRNPGATILFRGTNLGTSSIASSTANSSNIVFTTAPTLSGGGGAAGSTTVSILPGAIGDSSATGVGNGLNTGGLVTYDPAVGIRVLNPTTEYTAAITDGQTQLDNVRLAHTSGAGVLLTTLSSNTTINSLSFNVSGTGTDAGITVDGMAGVTLTIASGVIYTSSSASSATGNAQTISVPTLSLNGHEGIITAFTAMPGTGTISTSGLLNISSSISNDGGNGVTVFGNGTQGTNGGEVQFSGSTANTYTGTTTVNGIVLKLSKTSGTNAIPGDLVLNAGAIYDGNNEIADTSNVTINGGTFYQNGSNNSGSSTSEAIGSLTLNGGTISPGQGSSNTLTIFGTMTLNGSGFTTSTGGKLNVGGLATFTGGTLTLGISNSPSTFANVATFSSGIAIVNPASGAYTPITINAGSANLGGKLVLSGDLTFTGNTTNANTATINGAAGTSPGVFALDGTRSFNVGDGAAAVDLAITAPLTDNGANAGGLTKTGNGMLKLTAPNTYTGPTTVRGGTLEVSGSLNGSTTAPVNVNNGTLVLSAGNAISSPTSDLTLGDGLNLTPGTLKLNDSLSSVSETFGNLNLEFASTIDFGALNGNSLIFAGVGDHTPGATLSITDWSGNAAQAGGVSNDRLLFIGSTPNAFTSSYNQSDVSFNGVGGYMALQVDPNHFEIVAVPEPTPVALELSLGILGLIGFRRRRHTA